MSMDLYFWKAPVTDDPDEAKLLVSRHFDGDESVFEASPAIAAMAEQLLQLYPVRVVFGDEALAAIPEEDRGGYTEEALAELLSAGIYIQDEAGPWADLPFLRTDSLLGVNVRWSAADRAADDIARLAAEHDLVIYDPQGPDVYRARETPEPKPLPKPTAADFVKIILLAVPFFAATYAAWLIPWGWLRWPLVAIGLFLTAAALVAVYACITSAIEQMREKPAS